MKDNILHTLRYFALFKHPLTKDELHLFLNGKTSASLLEFDLNELIASNKVIQRGRFLQRVDDSDFSDLREQKEKKALEMIEISSRYARIISKFPFVKSVAISGSLSKLSAGSDADYDFFIVTCENRLWISRTLLHVFKKLTFLTGHENCFCMNYFVDESRLKLPFENYYTALELHTLIPVYGNDVHEQLKNENAWTSDYLPNHNGQPLASVPEINSKSIIKYLVEAILNFLFPRVINRWLMQLTDWKWRKKFSSLNLTEEEYDQALMTRIHISKNHPHDFQKRILEALQDNNSVEQEKNVYV